MIENNNEFPALEDLYHESQAQASLQKFGFADWRTAWAVLCRIEAQNKQGLSSIYTFLMTALGSAADPDRSLVKFERFVDGFGPKLFPTLKKNPRIIEILVTLFSASPFLSEILLRTPDALEILNNRDYLTERKTIEQFQSEVISVSQSAKSELDKLNVLRRYQRRQLLRIGASDFLGLFDLRTVFSQLSRMAIGLVRACLTLAAKQTGISPDSFVVVAMGKLGGWELNYSSDIDLLFVTNNQDDNYLLLAEQLIKNIASTTPEGFLYRVDLRLRPWGNDGPLITTLDVYLQYIQKHARLWEKQAFLKARSIAGNLSLGEKLRKEIEPFLFRSSAEEVRSDIYIMKQRTEEFLQKKGRRWGEVKLGKGSLRDIEFLVQFLQMTHPSVRTRATMKAIHQLREAGWLDSGESHILTEGYSFLRTIEHYMQMIDYQQTYTLPSDPRALALLARRFGFEGQEAGGQFVERYEQHCRAIRSLFLKYVGKDLAGEITVSPHASQLVMQHIAHMDTSYIETFSPKEIRSHTRLANRLDSETIVIVDPKPVDATRWRVTIVGYDYLGELSLICGLMFVYGLDIYESQAFTYEETGNSETLVNLEDNKVQNGRLKIVDVFMVRSIQTDSLKIEKWTRYSDDLHRLLKMVQAGHRREAQGELAKRAGEVFQGMDRNITPLYPIEIEIDNDSSNLYTILKINTTDTVGFLYEFSNALALSHINIGRMFVQTITNRVNDTIYVTDGEGHKITAPEKQRELRAATVLIKHFTHLLPHSPNPESALLHFRDLLGQLFTHPNWPDELVNLERPEVLDALARLLGVSDFLWDDFLKMQYNNLFPIVRDIKALEVSKDRIQLQSELEEILQEGENWRAVLNAFKDREMFRIDMRHILGYTPEFWEFSFALTDLVEIIVAAAYYQCAKELSVECGQPLLEDGSQCPATIVALGKCGGRELGFASDIELMLIYGGTGRTSGPRIINTSAYFEELMRSFLKAIEARQDGIFHIDLQLRPYGKAGSIAVSLDAFMKYFAPNGPAWAYERQALVKLRAISGDQKLGEKVSRLRDEYVYNGEPFNVTAMQAMRERQIRHLVNAGKFNAKYSPGGLVDLEYLIQGLQISHGEEIPSLRLTNIRMAMGALTEAGILSTDDYTHLRKAYTFLRWLIDSLRVVRGNSKDVNIPPVDSEEFFFLARRLRYGSDTSQLQEDISRYSSDVMTLNQKLLSISK
jgi:[glutamine synthetase] adenylyltransferase / [glutamine synthetase]-adenylyl-L-tyrosine phosphorylase